MRNTVIKVGLLLFAYLFISTPDVSALSVQNLLTTEKPFSYEGSLLLEAERTVIAQKKPEPKVEVAEKVVPTPPPVVTYAVAEGDSLTKISELHKTSIERIFAKNIQIENPDLLN